VKSIYSCLYGVFALVLYISLVWIVVDDFWDAFIVGGIAGLIISIALAPATIALFPLALGIFWGSWGQAVSTYLVLPVLATIHSFFKGKAAIE
jgi:hypothetical protein